VSQKATEESVQRQLSTAPQPVTHPHANNDATHASALLEKEKESRIAILEGWGGGGGGEGRRRCATRLGKKGRFRMMRWEGSKLLRMMLPAGRRRLPMMLLGGELIVSLVCVFVCVCVCVREREKKERVAMPEMGCVGSVAGACLSLRGRAQTHGDGFWSMCSSRVREDGRTTYIIPV